MRIVAAIQARMGSSRLPNKVMALIGDTPMAACVAWRVPHDFIGEVVFSIPQGIDHDALAYTAIEEGFSYYRGEEQDLLQRTLGTAYEYDADAIVRITADCPLLHADEINQTVKAFMASGADYCSNVFPVRTFPAGVAVEVYSTGLLEKLDLALPSFQDSLMRYREYFMVYLWEHAEQYKIASVVNDVDLSHLRWTVDYPEDLEFVRAVYKELGPMATMWQVLDLLKRRPDIAAINAHIATDPYHGLKQ